MKDSEGKLTQNVTNLKGLVRYQEGSIVSYEITHKSTGTITIFASDQGQFLSKHMTPFDAS